MVFDPPEQPIRVLFSCSNVLRDVWFPHPSLLFSPKESHPDMRWFAAQSTLLMILTFTHIVITNHCAAAPQDDEKPSASPALDSEDHLVQFQRDIVPVLRERCLQCHGPEDAKNDFRVDDREIMLDYIEAGNAKESILYIDYLTTDDEDMLMPPKSHGGALSVSDLAMIQVWINEGADWPPNATISETDVVPTAEPPPASLSFPERLWFAQGFLHPATVHFPIALFTLGAGFVILSLKWPVLGEQIPLACLLLGTASAVAASLMGWALAQEEGYGSNWDIFNWDGELEAHRWSAVIVTLSSVVFSIIALLSIRKDSRRLTKVWQIGLLVCAAMVGAVGHQGGEMVHGHDFYERAFQILTGKSDDSPATNTDSNPASDAESGSATDDQADLNHAEPHSTNVSYSNRQRHADFTNDQV